MDRSEPVESIVFEMQTISINFIKISTLNSFRKSTHIWFRAFIKFINPVWQWPQWQKHIVLQQFPCVILLWLMAIFCMIFSSTYRMWIYDTNILGIKIATTSKMTKPTALLFSYSTIYSRHTLASISSHFSYRTLREPRQRVEWNREKKKFFSFIRHIPLEFHWICK